MNNVSHNLRRFLADQRGVSLVEYTLLAGLIGLASFGALATFGQEVSALTASVAEATAN